jgi:putative endonuclease
MSTGLVRYIADLSNRWRSRSSTSRPHHLRLGTRGENLACQFLKKNRYKILYGNFKGRTGGEIDVVCRDHDTLVFVEVKTRTREDFGRPLDSVNREKRNRIARGGLAWLRLLDDPDILFRFDVVEVIIAEDAEPRLEIVQNAFSLPDRYIY